MLGFVSLLGKRLSRPEALGLPTFWMSVFIYFSATVLFDANRFGGPVILWFIGFLLGQVIVTAWAMSLKKVFFLVVKRPLAVAVTNVAIGVSAGVVRALALGLYTVGTGIAQTEQWQFRLPAGAIAGLVLVTAGAALMGATLEHRTVVASLRQTQARLLATRKNAPKLLEKTRIEIAELARRTLDPRFDEVQRKLKKRGLDTHAGMSVAEELSEIIRSEVRPISNRLGLRVDETLKETPKVPTRQDKTVGFPKEIDLAKALSPLATFLIALMLCVAMFATLTDRVTTVLSVSGALFALALLALLRKLLRNLRPMHLVPGTLALATIGAAVTLPMSVLTQLNLGANSRFAAMPYNSSVIIASLVVGIGYTKMVDIERSGFENELKEFNDSLEREQSWLAAQVWVIRRDWAYLLHGSVQSALTAAVARLTRDDLDEKTLLLVKQDVRRAQEALQQGVERSFDLNLAIEELVSSWQGICEVTASISKEVAETITQDVGQSRAVNEILREAVSNAVRHGAAENVFVELLATTTILEVRVTNDGTPVEAKPAKSVGSRMLDELALGWSLRSYSDTGKTVLKVKLAKATSSFS